MAMAELVSGMDDYRLKPPLFWSVVHDRLPDKKPSSPRFSDPARANPWTHLRARVGHLRNFIPFLLCKQSPSGTRIIKAYQPLGNINLEFDDSHLNYTSYVRELDLSTTTVKIKYILGAVEFTREHFSSNPHQVTAYK
ncbi:hypothetical protein IEQ34_019012 [Dendrobium chrysotoxum]|uniref:Glycosyl hydrolase family 95 N-terminal domain-containing protein n=1 Tax=Dendrobium chrysotoxum TaxID=161865 RepID=A0AAV7G8M6_DENCH|nr:hypothetical protein IEQ34_019012 [Dendrobium chrysotoxum]